MAPKHRDSASFITYDQLAEAWWDIDRGYKWCAAKSYRTWLVRKAFEDLLPQCGWSVDRWNEESDKRK